jgi:tetratricopeptide (TPR) repeat protein
MFTEEEFASLLNQPEGESLDFKAEAYNMSVEDDKCDLVKDVICMANTPRDGNAYIVIGVKKRLDNTYELRGVDVHVEGADLQAVLQARVNPVPRFEYRPVTYKGKQFGVIIILPDLNVPAMAIKDYRKSNRKDQTEGSFLRKGQVYLRRDSQNALARPEDIRRIGEWVIRKRRDTWLDIEIGRIVKESIELGQDRRRLKREAIVGLRFGELSGIFKNRGEKLADLRSTLADRAVKLICIVGRGGIGKTGLLTRVCAEIERGELRLGGREAVMGVDGIIYVSCRATDKPTLERVVDSIGRMLGERERLIECWSGTDRSLTERIREVLSMCREGSYLLVLENFEDALAGDGTIADTELGTFVDVCLTTSHGLRIIAASKRPAFVGSPGLVAVRTVLLDSGLPEDDAVALLRDLDPEGRLGLRDSGDKLLREAARRCYGVPYALHRLVGLLASDPALTLAELLDNAALFRELEHLIAEQYGRLNVEECRVVEALAVYGRPVLSAAVYYVMSLLYPGVEVDGCLRALVRGYFVIYHRGRQTYELHPLDEKYVYERIPEDGPYSRRALHRRAAEFYRQLRKPAEECLGIVDIEPQLEEFEHRVLAGEYDTALEVINSLDTEREGADQLTRWGFCTLVVEARTRLVGRLGRSELEELNWGRLGYAYDELGDADRAIDCSQHALDIATQLRNRQGQGKWLTNLGVSYLTRGRAADAIGFFTRALEIDRELLSRVDEARDLGGLGCAYAELGDVARAIECHERALAIDVELGVSREVAADLGNLGEACAQVGELARALEYHVEALRIDEEEEDRNYLAEDCNNLGTVQIALGNWDEAAEQCRRAVDIVRETRARDLLAEFAANYGQVLWLRGATADAVQWIDRGLDVARNIGNGMREATCMRVRGRIDHVEGRLDEAASCYESAVMHDAFPSNFQAALGLGIVAFEKGQMDAAKDHLLRAVDMCEALIAKTPRLYDALYCLATAKLALGREEAALAGYRTGLLVCSAKGVLELVLEDLRLLERASHPPRGVGTVRELLEAAKSDGLS